MINFPSNITTGKDRESFLKTRIDSLELPPEIFNILNQKNIRAVGGLINKTALEIGLKDIDMDIVTERLYELSLEIILRSYVQEIELQEQPAKQKDVKEIKKNISDKLYLKVHNDIVRYFADHFNMKKEFLIGQSRKKEMVQKRDVMIYILREYGKFSFPAIAKIVGNRDHSTIIHSFNKMEKTRNSRENFETEFHNLIYQSKRIKKQRALIKKMLSDKTLKDSHEIKHSDTKFKIYVPISKRDTEILALYRRGLTLENIAKVHNITRERVRQVTIQTIKNNLLNDSVSSGVKTNFETQYSIEKKIREEAKRNKRPKQEPKKYVRKYAWSRNYEFCKLCKTRETPHFRIGLCEECGNKSISGEARERMIEENNHKCNLCKIPREEAQEKYKKDFFLSRKLRSVLCRECFQKTTGKGLGDAKKNKWRKFYL
ncbi:MAG: hypothetical protein KBC22_00475 [Candidatus Pacebacteria bacterium]|nr:hypothetical protein [Candidatus Paceibacterota bacterium]